MKKTKQIIALLLCLVMVVAGSVFATVAYLTSQDSVLNTFTIGKVAIDLDETKVTPDGTPVDENEDGEPEKTQTGNEYHLIPGQTYTKDPTITVKAGSEESYVRMLVTVNGLSALKEIFGEGFLPQNYVAGWDPAVWVPVAAVDNGDNTMTYEFRYFEAVDATAATEDVVLDALFDSFTMPGKVTGEELAMLEGFKIQVDGHAIQAATFADANAAWAAFDAQYAEETEG